MSTNETEFPMLLLLTVLALVVVLVLAWLAIRTLASMNNTRTGSSKAVKVMQTVAVGNRERLVLIQYKGADVLLGVTPGGITVIDSDAESFQRIYDKNNVHSNESLDT